MTVMLVVLGAWVALSLLVGLTVGRAIRQADSAEFPARPAEWWTVPAASAETGAPAPASAADERTPSADTERVPHAA